MANDGDLNLKLEDDMSFTDVCVYIRNSAARSTKSFVRVLASDTKIIVADLGAGILEVTIAILYAIGVAAKTLMMFLVMSMMEKCCNMVKMEEEAAAALKAKADEKAAESKAKADEEMKAYCEEMKSEMHAKIQVLQAEIDELKREKND